MGEVIDSGGGIGIKLSPHRVAIEKAQAELRQEYDVREERRRELEFLEKGGNPLDFKFANAISHSVQSTSLTDKQEDHFLKSEVKDSFPRTASQHGDSVESSGRPGFSIVSEPNTADNLLLFDAETKSLEGERNPKYPNKRSRTSESERSFKKNNFQNTKETEDSAFFRPYARRNRSKINRDPARSSSTELAQSRGGLATSLSIRRESGDAKGSDSEAGNHKNIHDELVVRESTATTKDGPVKEKVDIVHKKSSADVASRETGLTGVKAHTVSASTVANSLSAVMKGSQETNSTQVNGLKDPRGEKESLKDSATVGEKGLDQESSHANNVEVDVDTKIDLHRMDKSDSIRIPMQSTSRVEGILNPTVGEMANAKREDEAGDSTIIIREQSSGHQSYIQSLKIENQDHRSTVELHNEKKCSETERKQQDDLDILQRDMKVISGLADTSESSLYPRKSQAAAETSTLTNSKTVLSGPGITVLNHQHSLDNGSRMLDTLKEDSILEEAQIIKEKRKRIAELSFGTIPLEVRTRSQWDFVLEEMAWLANDFTQERVWKMTAAMQICHRAAFTSQLKYEERIQQRKLKSLASTLANAVLQFWSSVEVPKELEKTSLGTDKETVKELKCDAGIKCSASGVTEYARKFLKFVRSSSPHMQAAAPLAPDNMCDPGILETSWDDRLTEESLFYSVPSGAMEAYRRSIESHLLCCEKSGSSIQEEVETSAYDPAEDTEYNGYDEDEEETSTYYQPGALERSKSFKLTHKKKKNLMKYHSARSYDIGSDLPYGSYTGGSNALMGKRPASNPNVGSVPMKRMRTASRQRVVSSFGCVTAGSLPVPSKTDASSGDTSSFQDDQSSLNGGSAVQKGTEVESSGNFERQLPYDMAETSGKPKKKKVHLGSAHEQAWHLDSMVRGEQDHWKKRPENHFNTNGLYVKKQKTAKQSMENNFDSAIPSPAASQMSNMSNPNKFIKFFGGRDRGRKIKGLKISSGQEGCENPWSLFEDQALVVLVHDMGPNWELISDAMNSTLKIKCIYRNPSECKERHKILMDRSGDDGADSAEDSGNSQSYPSTLPGIPKGSARQLFQRLQGPLEEDTLKSHFEKICSIGKKFQHRKVQNDGRDPKQIVPVHNSQVMALSHVFPNNLNGSILTPLDLCDASTSGQDVFSLEPLLNQGTSVLPAPGANPSITGSSAVVSGNNLSTTSGQPGASSRFNIPRGSFPLDEQHRNQQYNQILPGRNLQQPILPTPGAVSGPDLGHRLPCGNAMSVNGINRSTPLSRPGLQGVSSLAVPNTGSMISSGMGGISNSGNINSVGSTPQGNSMLRPRGAMQHMMRVAKGNGQGIPALSSGFTNQTTPPVQVYPGHLSQSHQLSQQSHVLGNSHNPHLQSPNLAAGTQQQAFANRQRQMHQRFLQQQKQQQQQFPVSGAMTSHVQSQHQIPTVSSSPQNSPQTQPLTPSQPLSMPLPSTSPNVTATAQQQHQKLQLPVQGLGRNHQSGTSGVTNQAGKQRQRQLQQQSGRQHPHQRQLTQGQQQNKLLKGMGRGNTMHQSISVDPSHLNGSTMSQGIQGTEKVKATVQAVPGQPSNPLAAVSLYPQSKPLVSPQSSSTSQQQPKTFPGAPSPASQQHQQRQLHSDNSSQGEKSAEVPGNILSTSSPSVTPAVAQPNHQHLLLHQKQGNQVQPTSHRTIHQNHDLSNMSQAEHSPHNPQSVVTNTTQTASAGTTKGVPQAGINSVSTAADASTAVHSPPKELNLPSVDSSEQNSVAKVSSCITNSSGSDPVTKMRQGLDLSPDGYKGGIEGQHQQLQQSPPLPHKQPQLSEQLLVQNQKHIPSEQQPPYLNSLELEAVHENSSSMPSDS
ncbi:Chromatin modification-related protein EAF1 A [Cardamine amara subsp. amara]|uniref:Chromatin modification-related protein EAF1 A n=1 Tax=Cardamine amara subsp. amara TaxID=228776 RepID=A0ABD1AB90_CARAN